MADTTDTQALSRAEQYLQSAITGESDGLPTPRSREEQFLKHCVERCGCDGLPTPRSRREKYLYTLAETMAGGGSGETENTLNQYLLGTKTDITAEDLAGVTEIRGDCFRSAPITSVEIPDSVTTIGWQAFTGCKNMASITLPDHPIHFAATSFAAPVNVERTVYITNLDTWCRHYLGNSHAHPFTGTSGHLYLNNEKVTELVIPDTITSLGTCTFFNCVDLTSVIIHDRVTSCNAFTFNGCTNLKTVSIGSGMQKLNDAFNRCTSLMEVTCLAETPPVLASNGLGDVPAECVIKVPAASVEAYKAAPNWIARADYIVAIEE